jgi:hypothetical protein
VKWRVDNTFVRTSLADFERVYFSAAFNDACVDAVGLAERRIVEDRVDDRGNRKRRTQLVPRVNLPANIAKYVMPEQIRYDEVSDFDAAQHLIRFRIDSKATERVRVSGTIRFTTPTPTSVRRELDGVIEVDAPFGVGLMVERFIEAEVQKSYAKLTAFCQQYLDDEHKRGAA